MSKCKNCQRLRHIIKQLAETIEVMNDEKLLTQIIKSLKQFEKGKYKIWK